MYFSFDFLYGKNMIQKPYKLPFNVKVILDKVISNSII